ncbi:MAG: undecaprenol kinase, undecaprenyl-diphosphatase [Candidatus Parcubacteria bacterium]|jgi:undecaprenyl-diphosphatase
MTILQAVLLAIVEGITEFLPISSTGHLVLTARLLAIEQTEFVKSFEIIIQLGAILAVVILYMQIFLKNKVLWKTIMIAFVPSMVVGFLFYKLIKTVLIGNPYITLVALFLGGVLILLLERRYRTTTVHTETMTAISHKQAFFIGLCQAVSVIPGVSRAGATILGGMSLGLSRKTAVEFSFLLAAPTMLAASVLDMTESYNSFTFENLILLSVGFVVSFLVAFGVMKWLLVFIKTNTLSAFGVYRIVLSLVYYVFVLR